MWLYGQLLQQLNSATIIVKTNRLYVKGWTWLCSDKTLFMKAEFGISYLFIIFLLTFSTI